jgi:hypothetical protein
MLYSKIIAVCSEIHTKHINSLCGQNVEFVNIKHGGTYSNHWALKRYCIPLFLFTFLELYIRSILFAAGLIPDGVTGIFR